MEVTWHGNTCFKFKGKKSSLLVNPDREAGKIKADVVLSSLKDPVEVEGAERMFTWPGEYECKDIPIVGIQAWIKTAKNDEKLKDEEKTTIYTFAIDRIKCCHLGDLGHVLMDEMINKIGDIDILIINAGKGANLDEKKALEVMEAIEPRAVIAMGEGSQEATLKMLGADKIEPIDKLSLKSASELPVEKRLYVALERA